METVHRPLSQPLQALLVKEVKNPLYRELITRRSNYYSELARSLQRGNGCLMPNEPLAGLTDGKEIMERILAPLRGCIVYLDVWGTWCGPCKLNLKHFTKPLHEMLGDLPVTFLYLCNNSTDESWMSTIAEYELTGDHSVHYNLPASQQQAVEHYLRVEHYPTYIIFDREGHRVDGDEPKPYNLEELKARMAALK
jgi:thiol-disulfide isomerase/thioredoxin